MRQQFVNLQQNLVGPQCSQRILQQTLRRELRAPLGVAGNQAHELLRIDSGIFHESNLQLAALPVDLGNAKALALESNPGGFKQKHSGVGWCAVAVFKLGANFGECLVSGSAGDLFLEPQALVFFGDVALVDAQGDAEIERRGGTLFAVRAPGA